MKARLGGREYRLERRMGLNDAPKARKSSVFVRRVIDTHLALV